MIKNYDTSVYILAKNKNSHMIEYYLILRKNYSELARSVLQDFDELFIEVFATEHDIIHNSITLLNGKTSTLGTRKISTLYILD